MKNLFWLMFIYFGMQGMDELGEFMTHSCGCGKGALKIFYQMNQFTGIALSCYVMYFVMGVRKCEFIKNMK